jgi:hypothetical protein
MCKARTPSLLPNVSKAVKTATPAQSNQGDESCHALRQSALDCLSSLSIVSLGPNLAVSVFCFRLQ